ncbi:MAG TPA: hypothetical protein VKY74_26850, partial [Chloroflexia bacterium]|nr:hypothetical protein [Chloroflexia bacterium]
MHQTTAQPARNRLWQLILVKFKRTPLQTGRPDPTGRGAAKWEHIEITLPIDQEQIRKQAQEWLKPERCPPSHWYGPTAQVPEGTTYESYFKTQLRLRYVELADLFRASIGNHYSEKTFDIYAARSIAEMLQTTEPALGESDPDLLGIS